MENKPVPFLCGGTFFLLLTRYKAKWKTNAEIQKEAAANPGKTMDNNANKDVLADLIKIYDPGFYMPAGGTFEGEVSNFRSCQMSYSGNLPFNDTNIKKAFNERIEKPEKYAESLAKMKKLVKSRICLDEDRMSWLLKAMLTLLAKDKTIPDDTMFYAQESGEPISKADLLAESDYCIDALLLGLWHFVVTHRGKKNEIGRATFEAWNERPKLSEDINKKYGRWSFKSNIGVSYPKEVSYKFSEDVQPNASAESIVEDEQEIEGTETIEAEVVDDDEFQSKQNKKKSNDSGGQTMIFNNDGDGDMFCFVGTINNYGK